MFWRIKNLPVAGNSYFGINHQVCGEPRTNEIRFWVFNKVGCDEKGVEYVVKVARNLKFRTKISIISPLVSFAKEMTMSSQLRSIKNEPLRSLHINPAKTRRQNDGRNLSSSLCRKTLSFKITWIFDKDFHRRDAESLSFLRNIYRIKLNRLINHQSQILIFYLSVFASLRFIFLSNVA